MRIDEFSKPSDVDNTLSATENTRFMLVGFDLTIPLSIAWTELVSFNSLITIEFLFDSLLSKTKEFMSSITKTVSEDTTITKEVTFKSQINKSDDVDTPLGD